MKSTRVTKLFTLSFLGVCFFQLPGSPSLDTNGGQFEFIVGDFNGDKNLDILTYRNTNAGLELRLFQSRNHQFEECTRLVGLPSQVNAPIQEVYFKKLSKDGFDAIVLASKNRPERMFRYRPESQDLEEISHQLPSDSKLSWCDYDADGLSDLASKVGHEIHLYPNQGNEKKLFGEPVIISSSYEDWLSSNVNDSETEEAARGLNGRSPAPSGAPDFLLGSGVGELPEAGGIQDPETEGQQIGGADVSCVLSIDDLATANCISASSVPSLGRLYPLSENLFVKQDGKVGMGLTNPMAKLHLKSDTANLTAPNGILSNANVGALALSGAVAQGIALDSNLSTKSFLMSYGASSANELHFRRLEDNFGNLLAGSPFIVDMDAPDKSFVISDSGNIQIGNPNTGSFAKLHLDSNTNIGATGIGGMALTGSASLWQGVGFQGSQSDKSCLVHYGGGYGVNELRFGRFRINFGDWESNPYTFDMDAPSSSLVVTQNGNVGLGMITGAPNARLHLESNTGNIGSTGTGGIALSGNAWQALAMDGVGSTKSLVMHYGDSSNQLRLGRYDNNFGAWQANPFIFDMDAPNASLVATENGNLGLGTATPKAKLHIESNSGNIGSTGIGGLALTGSTWQAIAMDGGPSTKSLIMHYGGDTTNQLLFGRYANDFGSWEGNPVVFDMDAPHGSFVLAQNGNVGIGTANPEERLHVVGTTKTSILEITGGSDLAEAFDVSEANVEPGMVVSIDAKNPGRLRLANTEYDSKVAGVVSGAGGVNVGMKLYQAGVLDGSHPVALAGRVYTWCDASNGAIEPGDLLTSSTVAGYAMKATDRDRSYGAVIGKAMTTLKEGRGLVLVLIQPR